LRFADEYNVIVTCNLRYLGLWFAVALLRGFGYPGATYHDHLLDSGQNVPKVFVVKIIFNVYTEANKHLHSAKLTLPINYSVLQGSPHIRV
jgi:hypothetical protein